jgi:SAM-dependent methyltransferase
MPQQLSNSLGNLSDPKHSNGDDIMTTSVQLNHPSVPTDDFISIEEYALHLIHLKAYEHASEICKGRAVLDWGCNNGWGLPVLAKTSSRVGGLDTNESRVLEARSRYPEYAKDIWLYDGVNVPFSERDWGAVVSFQVIEHVKDVDGYLKTIASVLSDQGVVLFATPNRETRLDPGMKPWNEFHVTEFTAAELKTVLQTYFKYVEIYGLQGAPEITDVERQRTGRARDEARRQNSIGRRSLRYIKGLVKFKSGALDVPGQIHGRPISSTPLPRIPDSVIKALSTSQLHYTQSEYERAVDLVAICSNTPI